MNWVLKILHFIFQTLYSIFTLKRWSSSIYSYGAIGMFGVVCALLSVVAGLMLASLSNLNLNSISVQVSSLISNKFDFSFNI